MRARFFLLIKKQIKEGVCRMQWNVGWCSTLLCCQQTLHRPTALYFAQRCPIFFPFLVGPKCPLASTNFFGEFLYQTNYEVMHTNKVGSYSGLPVSQIKRQCSVRFDGQPLSNLNMVVILSRWIIWLVSSTSKKINVLSKLFDGTSWNVQHTMEKALPNISHSGDNKDTDFLTCPLMTPCIENEADYLPP